jgi:serine/threonine-protein kinase HipA
MAYRPVEVVEVLAWGERVGAVAANPATGWYAFGFDPAWVQSGIELAPVHMPLRTAPFEFAGLRRETFYGLPPLLADALPDSFGNALVDAWMAEQGVRSDQITPLDRLAYAADRAMGALEFRPPARGVPAPEPSAVQLAELVSAARRTVSGQLASDDAAHAALEQLIQVGTSAGGARAKAVVAFHPETSEVRSAYGPTPDGFEHWMIKLDGVSAVGMDGHGSEFGSSAPFGRIEHAYWRMATSAGLEMSECRLLHEGPRRHFMTRRFDRGPAGERHHVVTLCAMAHLDFNLVATHSYDQYLQTVRALDLGPDALHQAFRRMVFNVAAVNRDDHTKNVSFLRRRNGPWELAPAYDVAHAYSPTSPWVSRHLMAVNGRFDGIAIDDLHAVGERNEVPGYRRAVREVVAAVGDWRSFAAESEVPDDVAEAVWADIDRFRPR